MTPLSTIISLILSTKSSNLYGVWDSSFVAFTNSSQIASQWFFVCPDQHNVVNQPTQLSLQPNYLYQFLGRVYRPWWTTIVVLDDSTCSTISINAATITINLNKQLLWLSPLHQPVHSSLSIGEPLRLFMLSHLVSKFSSSNICLVNWDRVKEISVIDMLCEGVSTPYFFAHLDSTAPIWLVEVWIL